MSKLSRKSAVVCALVAFLGTGSFRRAGAQAPTGEFLCSVPGGAAPDGVACNTDDDCGAGVCVIAQGVCNAAGASDDGFPCDCAGGTCQGSTCQGGTSAGLSCDPTTNCSNNQCVGAQKVCVGGSQEGFSCLRSNQCPGSQCVSTGKFCGSGTDFASYTCVKDADCCSNPASCPAGACQGKEATPTATRTPVVSKPTNTPTVRVATSTPGPGTPVPTATPTSPGANTPPATSTPRATPTLGPQSGVVAAFAPAGSASLSVFDASNLPTRGTVQIGNDSTPIGYSRCAFCDRSNTLRLTTPLSNDVAAGTVVTTFALTPTLAPAVQVYQSEGTGAGCSIGVGAQGGSGAVVILVALGLLCGVAGRRNHQ